MALETAFFFAEELLKLNAFILIGLICLMAYVAYKLFAILLRILMTGLAFGAFPILANLVGLPVPINLQTILISIIVGILIGFAYLGISFGYKVLNTVFSPFKKTFGNKEKKVVVKKVVKEERKGESG